MDNIQFEISHDRVIAIIAKHIDVPAEQITLQIQGGDGQLYATAVVRADLPTVNKIDRKLKRLGIDSDPDSEPDSQAPQVRHG